MACGFLFFLREHGLPKGIEDSKTPLVVSAQGRTKSTAKGMQRHVITVFIAAGQFESDACSKVLRDDMIFCRKTPNN